MNTKSDGILGKVVTPRTRPTRNSQVDYDGHCLKSGVLRTRNPNVGDEFSAFRAKSVRHRKLSAVGLSLLCCTSPTLMWRELWR